MRRDGLFFDLFGVIMAAHRADIISFVVRPKEQGATDFHTGGAFGAFHGYLPLVSLSVFPHFGQAHISILFSGVMSVRLCSIVLLHLGQVGIDFIFSP